MQFKMETKKTKNQNRTGYFLKNIAIFGIGNIGTKFIAFFMVPVYTNVLSASEYGTIDLIAAVSMLAVPLLTLNVEEAVMRFSLDKNADYSMILSCGLFVLCIGFAAGLLLIPAASCFHVLSEYAAAVFLYVCSYGACQFFLCFLRGKELLSAYCAGSILNSFLIAGFNILFLNYFAWGITGYLSAYIAASLITAAFCAAMGSVFSHIRNGRLNKRLLKDMVTYSAVLIPNSFMWWIMNSSDRLMVTALAGADANGIYSVASKFPALMAAFSSIFTKAWSYSAIREDESEDRDAYSSQMFSELAAFLIVTACFLIFIMKPFLSVYVSQDFYSAWKYTPFLITGSVFLSMASFLSISYTVKKDSLGFLISGTMGAVINVILNLILIPKTGIYGAAAATCVSYLVVFLYRAWDVRKYISICIFRKKNVWGIVLLVAASGMMFVENTAVCESVTGLCLLLAACLFREELYVIWSMAAGRIRGFRKHRKKTGAGKQEQE